MCSLVTKMPSSRVRVTRLDTWLGFLLVWMQADRGGGSGGWINPHGASALGSMALASSELVIVDTEGE